MRRLQGLGAVDMRKRCADLRRMAAPGSGASDAERAFALKRLERDCAGIEAEAPRASRPEWRPSWSSASAPPWQTDPRDNSTIYENSVRDLNFTKKKIHDYVLSWNRAHGTDHRHVKVTFHGFDGRYGRDTLTAYSSFATLGWGAFDFENWAEDLFKTPDPDVPKFRNFQAVIGMVEGEAEVRVLRVRGRDVSAQGILVEHASFNQNPFNDSGFAARLNRAIAKL